MKGDLTKKKWLEKKVRVRKGYKRIVYTRFFIFALLIFLQLLAFVLAIVWLDSKWWMVNVIFTIIGLIFVLSLFNAVDRPSSKLSWVVVILLFPLVGVPTYLVFGGGRPMRRLLRRIEKARAINRQSFDEVIPKGEEPSVGNRYFLEKIGFPAFTDGDVVYYPTGKQAFEDMLSALEKAEKYILVEYFIIASGKMWTQMLTVLLDKAMQGVKVYILYDDFGSMLTLPPRYDRYLEKLHENIRCVRFNRVAPIFSARMNNRDHRKMLVVDGKVAFTGGINLADEYIDEKKRFGYWKDSAIKVTGGAVNAFVLSFFNLYNAVKQKEEVKDFLLPPQGGGQGCIQPYDDMPGDKLQTAETVYLNMIASSKKRLYIMTPYLILDDVMRTALCLAAMRGVDVRIVTPGVPDKKLVYRLTRANYALLMKSGVKIYEYTPGFIHAKNVLVDDAAVVGSVNFDYRSLYLHFENAVYFTGSDALAAMEKDFEEVFSVSKLCDKRNCRRRLLGRLLDANLRVFETLM